MGHNKAKTFDFPTSLLPRLGTQMSVLPRDSRNIATRAEKRERRERKGSRDVGSLMDHASPPSSLQDPLH